MLPPIAQYTPLTPTRRNCRVASRRRCEHNSQLAHDDCRRIQSTIWKLNIAVWLRAFWSILIFNNDVIMSSLVTNLNSSRAQEIVNWVTTADGCVHSADTTQLDSCVESAVCIGLMCMRSLTTMDDRWWNEKALVLTTRRTTTTTTTTTTRNRTRTMFVALGITPRTMFMVLSSWLTVIARVHLVQSMNAEQRQMAADFWTKPTDLSHKPACRQLRNYTYHRHLLLLSPRADTHFTIPRRVEGWVDLDG